MAMYNELGPYELVNANFIIMDSWNGEKRYFRKFNHSMAIMSFLDRSGCKEAVLESTQGRRIARLRPSSLESPLFEMAIDDFFMTRKDMMVSALKNKRASDEYYAKLQEVRNTPKHWAYTATSSTVTYD